MGVAGLLDLLRTQGMWKASVRYGYVFGKLRRRPVVVAAIAFAHSPLCANRTRDTHAPIVPTAHAHGVRPSPCPPPLAHLPTGALRDAGNVTVDNVTDYPLEKAKLKALVDRFERTWVKVLQQPRSARKVAPAAPPAPPNGGASLRVNGHGQTKVRPQHS